MAFFLFALVIVFNILLCVLKKRSRIIAILSVVILALLMAYSGTSTGDLAIFKAEYLRGINNTRWEVGYQWLSVLCRSVGMSFDVFRLVIFFSGFLMMYLGFRGCSKNWHLFIALYALSLFEFCATALRFYLGLAIVCFAFRFLWRRKPILYVLIVLLASLFHQSVLICLIFVICFLPQKTFPGLIKVLSVVYVVCLAIVAVFVLFPGISSALTNVYRNILSSFSSSYIEESDTYLTGGYSRNRVIYSILYTVFVLLLYVCRKYLKKCDDPSRFCFLDIAMIVALAGGLFLPVIMIMTAGVRMLFVEILLCICVFARTIDHCDAVNWLTVGKIKIDRTLFALICTIATFGWFFVFYLSSMWSFDFILFLDHNSLF